MLASFPVFAAVTLAKAGRQAVNRVSLAVQCFHAVPVILHGCTSSI